MNNELFHSGLEESQQKKAELLPFPLLYTGLDPITHVFTKLFIRDVHNLKELDCGSVDMACPVQSGSMLLSYKDHLVMKVELIGLVVMVDIKDIKDSYAIDDGTGVIMCKKWNNRKTCSNPCVQDALPESLQMKQKEIISHLHSLEDSCVLGDVMRVRGRIVLYQGRKEIEVFSLCALDNPTHEINRVLELPNLYSNFYDQPVSLPMSVRQKLSNNENDLNERICHAVQSHLNEDFLVTKFDCKDVVTWPCIVNLFDSKEKATECLLSGAFLTSLDNLSKTMGLVCPLTGDGRRYEVVKQGCHLCTVVVNIIQTYCSLENNAERGCHILHIKDKLRCSSFYDVVELSVLSKVLSFLEYDSEIVCVDKDRYLATI